MKASQNGAFIMHSGFTGSIVMTARIVNYDEVAILQAAK